MKLIIDIGNTQTKLALFENNSAIASYALYEKQDDKIHELSKQYTIHRAIISSVKEIDEDLFLLLKNLNIQHINLTESTPLPIINCYASPKTLGKDRLAGVVGANNKYPNSNVLVIDAGTAITYDFITAKKEYLGGGISPGLQIRFKALHHYTDKLPLLAPEMQFSLMGTDTKTSIISGVQNGLIAEVDGIIDRYKNEYHAETIILTGGDAVFFDKKLKNTIFVDQNLILTGLNRILDYNA